jgi:hypothetical protein
MSLIHELVVHFRISPGDLLQIISTAPARYKQYTIPKRRGGVRLIAQPSRELKAIQRYLLETKLSTLPVHAAATGYIKGHNILQNAEHHQHSRVILKLDFVDFFPSIKVPDWDILFKVLKTPLIQPNELSFYKNLLFWGQGAKTPRCRDV